VPRNIPEVTSYMWIHRFSQVIQGYPGNPWVTWLPWGYPVVPIHGVIRYPGVSRYSIPEGCPRYRGRYLGAMIQAGGKQGNI